MQELNSHSALLPKRERLEFQDYCAAWVWSELTRRECENLCKLTYTVKVILQQAEVAKGLPSRLRPRIFLTFGTTMVVGRQPYTTAAFTPEEIRGTRFQRLSRHQGTWFCRGNHGKKSPVTPPGIYPETVRLVAHCLNHYATPGPMDIS